MGKKKLTRQAMMKVDPNWLLILADSLRLVVQRLEGGPLLTVREPPQVLLNLARALTKEVDREYDLGGSLMCPKCGSISTQPSSVSKQGELLCRDCSHVWLRPATQDTALVGLPLIDVL